jgi:ABC-2 type transport system ATP-binding protein
VNGAPPGLLDSLRELPGVSSVVTDDDGQARIEVTQEDTTQVVLTRLVEGGVTSIRTSLPSLEEVYLHLVGGRGMAVDQ